MKLQWLVAICFAFLVLEAAHAEIAPASLRDLEGLIDGLEHKEQETYKGALRELLVIARRNPRLTDYFYQKLTVNGAPGGAPMLEVALYHAAADCNWDLVQLKKRFPSLYKEGGVMGILRRPGVGVLLVMTPNNGVSFSLVGKMGDADVHETMFMTDQPRKWELRTRGDHTYLITSRPRRPAARDKYLIEERKSWRVDNFKFEHETTEMINHPLTWRP